MRVRAATLLLGALLGAATASAVFGQGFQGGIRGAVKDPGGVIPGVEVVLTNEQTNVKRSVVTNDRGEYVFANVDPGTYKVTATLQGYKTVDRGGIRVGTQQFLTLDLMMEVGSISENVTVTGEAPLIDTSNASTGTVLDTQALQTLPAPGRNAFMIGTTVPTVIPSGDTQFNRQQDQTNASLLSLGGGTRRGNNYTLDGVPITDLRNRASANPTIEALDDVKVQVHTYDAEMGRTGGGVFNTTLRSGTNNYHGTVFYQDRPIALSTNNYFSEKAGLAKPDNPYNLGGGGFGGPIQKDRTFFWFATENYTDTQTRNATDLMPTDLERAGNFSQTTNAAGQQVVIYDPLTRQPFPGNVIPTNRLNPIALQMLQYLPHADTQVDNGSANYNRTSLIKSSWTQEYTWKVEHKFSDKVSLSGFYLYNRSNEPCANYFGSADQKEPTRFADPLDYLLVRRPKILAVNNTWVLSDSSVMALRFGWTDFPDNDTLSIPFDPASLGFSQTFLSQMQVQKFPDVNINGYNRNAGQTLGAIDPTDRDWKSTSANASFSKFIGTHTVKAGADFRKIGLDFRAYGTPAGLFQFDKDTTSSNGGVNSSTDGNAFASFLLGFPTGLPSEQSQISLSTPVNIYTYYYGGYLQDDWRVNSKVTLNYGLRLEHETGIAEQNNNFTVGFDPNATLNGVTNVVTIPADPIAGTPARTVTGGLMYAGVNGNPTTQGNPPKIKASPRVGLVYSVNSNTVIRGGYGLYWAPYNYPAPSTSQLNYGQVGFSQNTTSPQSGPGSVPAVSISNPFPNGLVPIVGAQAGTLAGIGTNISYVDQNSDAPRVHQYSVDLQRELPGNQSISVGYTGSRGDHLGLGGSNDVEINYNQLDPRYMALGAALSQSVPNPFFGNPNAGPLATQATITRAQSLRPYPQFQDIWARHVLEGKSRYNAAVIEWSKRVAHGWGGRVSYTYSVLKDNLIGESNFYSANVIQSRGQAALNNYNYIPGSSYYNPDADYGYSILDVPHRVIIAPIVELPFGRGKRYGSNNGAVEWLLGGWQLSAAMNIQSGFPLEIRQTDNTGTFSGIQRPNVVPGASLATPGSYEDRLASNDHSTATWINPAAFTAAPAFTYGDAPRTITDLRSPGQFNTDAVFIKNFRLAGTHQAQIKIEMLNLFNRVNVRALQGSNNFSNSSFGQTSIQAGFMRITQLMFRYSF